MPLDSDLVLCFEFLSKRTKGSLAKFHFPDFHTVATEMSHSEYPHIELAVLRFKVLNALEFAGRYTRELTLALVIGRFADSVLATDLSKWEARSTFRA